MSQEAITEIDMDVFSRRIGPYFSWLESRIESGWEQNDSIEKDVLKEVRYLATNMRARFILGVAKEDFAKEVERTLELFQLAGEAFPDEVDDVESKVGHFVKGISEELGPEFLPDNTPRPPEPLDPHPVPEPRPIPVPEPVPEPEEPKPEPQQEKVAVQKPKVEIVSEVKVTKKVAKVKKVKKVKSKVKPVETKVEPKVEAKQKVTVKPKVKAKPAKKARKSKKKFFLVRWARNFIYGDDI